MRAAVLLAPGTVPVVQEHPEPVGTPGRSIVRVTAAPVVPLDLLCASGTSYFGVPATPYVPGVQGVGTVARSAVLAEGTRVWFATSAGMAPGDGALAELCSVSDDDLVPVAAEVDDATMAALGLSAVAAWMSLSWRARLQPGESVLVLGGGGAVGQSAIGAAKVLGASRVVAVARPGASVDRARAAGADEVVELVEDLRDLVTRLRAACPAPVDVVIDPAWGTSAAAATAVMATGGRLVNLGGSAGDDSTFSSAVVRSRSLAILGYTNNTITVAQRADAIASIATHAAAGRLVVAHTSAPLTEADAAWRWTGRSGTRSVLRP